MLTENKYELIIVDNIIYVDFVKYKSQRRFKTKGELREEKIKREREQNNKRITAEIKQLRK